MRSLPRNVCLLAALLACKHRGSEPTPGPPTNSNPSPLPTLRAPVAHAADFTLDPDLGIRTSRTRLLVLLKKDATGADADAVIKAAGRGAVLIASVPEIGTIMIEIPDSADHALLRAARNAVVQLPAVEGAQPDVLAGKTSLPPSPQDASDTPQGTGTRGCSRSAPVRLGVENRVPGLELEPEMGWLPRSMELERLYRAKEIQNQGRHGGGRQGRF